ncbi:hypothetical protein N7493_009009 [Penicillium malachiteum]|uniref:Uncharacterized protein n=1 Tax=Penicillium malachiteum TaxID=1324776 RepID=A0AAD6HFU8_9EURO|nr:hypothetical protein N7493_009009 [Penicillium malachiteum]
MSGLLERLQEEQSRIVREVLKLGVEVTGFDVDEIISDFLERLEAERGRVTKEVLKIAAANPKGGGFFKGLLEYTGNNSAVPEEVIMTAARNTDRYAYLIMKSILDHQGEGFLVPEEVLKEAAVNSGEWGYKIIETILEERESLVLSEEVVKEVTKHANWEDMFDALFRVRGESVPLSKEVLKAAAENIGEDETRMMEILCQNRQRIADRFW